MDVMTSLFSFSFTSCHKRLDGVFDNRPKESMAGLLLHSPLFETHENESRVDRSRRVGVMPVRLRHSIGRVSRRHA
jgi:hypothetical protein